MTTGDRYLVDTNVLAYAYDQSEPAKQERALRVLDQLAAAGAGVLSTQVLGELFRVVTRKLPGRLPPEEARRHLHEYVRSWRVLDLTCGIVLESARGVVEHQFPFYDAQIWATAKQNHVPVVLSEDFAHESRVEGVRFLNPFAAKLPGEEPQC